MKFDIDKIRADFPILDVIVNKNKLVYFDNGATTQKPQVVLDTINDCYKNYNSNIHRGVHFLSQKMSRHYDAARKTTKDFINAKHEHEVIFTTGTTGSINLVAATFSRRFINKGDEIIISTMEHHSNIVPWQIACEQYGAKLRVIPINEKGEIIFEEFEKLLNDRTKIIAVTHISNTLGTVLPIKKIIKSAHEKDIPVLIDGAQSIQHTKIDVQDLDCDFFVFSGHKIYGPTGIGVLYGKEKWLNKLPPYQGGGGMIDKVTFEKSTWADLPGKFEAGTVNFVGAVALAEAIKYIDSFGVNNIAAYEAELLKYALKRLKEVPGLKIIGEADHRASVISFLPEDGNPYPVGMKLDEMGIAVRTGHHCAMPLMDHYGIKGTVRLAIAMYNTKEEIDKLCDGLIKIENKDYSVSIKSGLTYSPSDRLESSNKENQNATKSYDEIINEIVEDLAMFEEEGIHRTTYLEELALSLPMIEDKYRTNDYLIEGCQSKVWLFAELKNGKIVYTADGDVDLVKGLAFILIKLLSNREPKEIMNFNTNDLDKLGLTNFITAKRGNGVLAMLQQMKLYAIAFNAQMQKQ